jgi:hypothetical protein
MNLRSIATGLLLVLSGAATAQTLAPATDVDDTSMVVWRLSPDGDRVQALTGPERTPSASFIVGSGQPAARSLGDSALPSVAGALRLEFGGATQLSLGASRRWSPSALAVRAPWCDGIAGLLAISGSASECLALDSSALQPRFDRTETQMTFGSGALDLAVSYGVSSAGVADSWLLPPDALSSYRLSPLGLGTVDAPFGSAAGGASQDLSVLGTWRLDPSRAINVGAAVGQSSLQLPAFRAPIELEQAAVGVGLSRGAFSGSIVGRVMRSTGNALSSMRSGLDIGVSRRTPWHAELSFGARNLLSRGEVALPDPAETALDESTARTPYVRYKQDL